MRGKGETQEAGGRTVCSSLLTQQLLITRAKLAFFLEVKFRKQPVLEKCLSGGGGGGVKGATGDFGISLKFSPTTV